MLIWLDDLPVAFVRQGVLYLVEADHLGTLRRIVDPVRGVAVWQWSMLGNPFGETPADADSDGDGTAFVFNPRFPGQYFDAESGLHYNYFRDYEPGTGRYVESDPIGLRGGISTYGYALSRPLVLFDPNGAAPQVISAALIGCLAGCAGSTMSDYGKCVYARMRAMPPGADLVEELPGCAQECAPHPCAFFNRCAQGCVAGAIVSGGAAIGLGASMTATYGVVGGTAGGTAASEVLGEMFKPEVCKYFYMLGPLGGPPP